MKCDMKAGLDFCILVYPQMVIPFNPVLLHAIIRMCHYISLSNFFICVSALVLFSLNLSHLVFSATRNVLYFLAYPENVHKLQLYS